MRRSCFIVGLVVCLVMPSVSFAAGSPADACIGEIQQRLGREQRLYRQVLFGVKRAQDEIIGTSRYDRFGTVWLKTAVGTWARNKEFINDASMDQATDRDPLARSAALPLQGIFETKGVLTSELVPSLTQSYRALQCRTQAVCEAVARSRNNDQRLVGGMYMTQPPGCRVIPQAPLVSCLFSASVPSLNPEDWSSAATVATYCDPVASALLNREADLLKLSVTYDAAYRSLLQVAGTFDDIIDLFQVDLLRPLEQSASLVTQLSRIPCFVAQCNE